MVSFHSLNNEVSVLELLCLVVPIPALTAVHAYYVSFVISLSLVTVV